MPASGIYAGFAAGHRAAVSIGTNPHYGGHELRVEAFLLGFAGDLYGRRLVVELWRRLRDERAFGSEQELIDQIARDVEETEQAESGRSEQYRCRVTRSAPPRCPPPAPREETRLTPPK